MKENSSEVRVRLMLRKKITTYQPLSSSWIPWTRIARFWARERVALRIPLVRSSSSRSGLRAGNRSRSIFPFFLSRPRCLEHRLYCCWSRPHWYGNFDFDRDRPFLFLSAKFLAWTANALEFRVEVLPCAYSCLTRIFLLSIVCFRSRHSAELEHYHRL